MDPRAGGRFGSGGTHGGMSQTAQLMEMWLAHVEQANLEHALAESMRQYEVDSEKQKKGIDTRLLEVVCLDIEDIENNKECAICFEEQRCGDQAVRLSCGHCFHQKCCVPWFAKHTTCPVCRLEVDPSTESAKMSKQELAERQRHQEKLNQKRQAKADRLEEQMLRMKKLDEENRRLAPHEKVQMSTSASKETEQPRKADSKETIDFEDVPLLKSNLSELSIRQLKSISKSLGLEVEAKAAIEKEDLVLLLTNAASKCSLASLTTASLKGRLRSMECQVDDNLSFDELVALVVTKTKSVLATQLKR